MKVVFNLNGFFLSFKATVNILNRLDVILAKSPIEEVRSEIIPLVFNCLESTSIQAQVNTIYLID